jgi:hypothetical protein
MAKRKNGLGAPPKIRTAKREKKRPAATITAPVSVEQLDDSQLQVLFFQHKRKVKELTATRDVAKAEAKRVSKLLSEAFGIAEAEGISKDELELALRMETDEGKREIEIERTRQERVSRWMGEPLGSQSDLVADAHFDAGKRAAMSDEIRKPPKHLHLTDVQRWLEGFDEGVQLTNASRASGFKRPIGDQPSSAVAH